MSDSSLHYVLPLVFVLPFDAPVLTSACPPFPETSLVAVSHVREQQHERRNKKSTSPIFQVPMGIRENKS